MNLKILAIKILLKVVHDPSLFLNKSYIIGKCTGNLIKKL